MAKSYSYVQELISKMSIVLPEQDAKRVQELAEKTAKLAGQNMTEEFRKAAKEIGEIFNKALIGLGKQDNLINLAEMIQKPDMSTIKTLAQEFTSRLTNEINAGLASSNIGGQLDKLLNKTVDLKKKQTSVKNQLHTIHRLMNNTDRYVDEEGMPQELRTKEKFHAYTIKEVQDNGGAEKFARQLIDTYNSLLNTLRDLTPEQKEYQSVLIDTYKAAEDVYRMRSTLDKHPNLISNEDILFDYDPESLKAEINEKLFGKYHDGLAKLEKDAKKFLKAVEQRLEAVNNEIVKIQGNSTGADQQANYDVEINKLNQIESAYKRILTTKGELNKSGKNIAATLMFDPSSSKKGIKSIRDEYTSLHSDANWEERAQALLKYVKLYEYYRDSDNKTWNNKANQDEYRNLYNQLKPLEQQAKSMLTDVLNRANNMPLTSVSEDAIKAANVNKDSLKLKKEEVVVSDKIVDAAEKEKLAQEDAVKAEKDRVELQEKRLMLYRRVDGELDVNRISNRSIDALYNKEGKSTIKKTLSFGYGSYGDGLFTTTGAAAPDIADNLGDGNSSWFGFDASEYKFYVNKTAEQAEAFKQFSLSLQKFVGQGSLFDGSDADLSEIENLDQAQLYDRAKEVVLNFNMTRQEFDAWINNAKVESERIAGLFAEGKVPENKHNFTTRFMQHLGYDGIINDTGNIDYDGENEGSVIFDPDVDKLKASIVVFKSADEMLEYIKNNAIDAKNAINDFSNSVGNISNTDGTKLVDSDATVSANKQKIQSYKELCKVIERLNELKVKSKESLTGEESAELESIYARLNATKGSSAAGQEVADMIKWVSMLDNAFPTDSNEVAKYLGIEIPDAANKAESAIDRVVTAQKDLNQTEQQSPPAKDDSNVHDKNAEIEQQNNLLKENIDLKTQEDVVPGSHSADEKDENETIAQQNDLLTENINLKKEEAAITNTKTDTPKYTGGDLTDEYLNPSHADDEFTEDQHYDGAIPDSFKKVETAATDAEQAIKDVKKAIDDTTTAAENLGDEASEAAKKTAGAVDDVNTKPDETPEDKQKKKQKETVNSIQKEYEKLGKLRARYDITGHGKQVLTDQEKNISDLEKKQKESDERVHEYKVALNKAYNSEVSNILDAREKTRKETEVNITQRYKNQAGGAYVQANDLVTDLSVDDTLSTDIKTKYIADLTDKMSELKRVQDLVANSKIITEEQKQELMQHTNNVQNSTKEIKEMLKQYERLSGDNVSVYGKNALYNGASDDDFIKQGMAAINAVTRTRAEFVSFDNVTKQVTARVKEAGGAFKTYTSDIRQLDNAIAVTAGKTTKTAGIFASIANEIKKHFVYLTGAGMMNMAAAELKKGIQYVREIDSALTELKKVTDETEESYDKFLNTASKTASKVGSTIKDIVSSTADWAKLGYSIEEAHKLAESTAVLMNVSEFDSIDSATSAMVSTLQAFSIATSDSMTIVDKFNQVGNEYAVSSAGIATALQDSASALMSANNDLDQSIALVAAANRVVQNESEVGAALRTISLRLRGTSVSELEELGEDTEGTVESVSKLQSKLQALTGVNILTDSGAYKSTYEILLEISRVWDSLTDSSRAATLELLAGKNRANVASAILTNTKDLEGAYASALNAEGKQHCLNVQKCA